MNAIHQTLTALSAGEISVEEALLKIRKEPLESIGYANIDSHRAARQGVPEVVYGANKTKEQLLGILRAMMAAGQEVILTPHEGEAARLLGWKREKVAAERESAAFEIASRYGATVVLKGRGTFVVSADGARKYINTTGNPCMALGGMGDLLAGVIGARWAYLKCDAFLAAASSVWLHGAAADCAVASGREPSISNTAAEVGALRIRLDGENLKSGETT
jgi:hypothetical protein